MGADRIGRSGSVAGRAKFMCVDGVGKFLPRGVGLGTFPNREPVFYSIRLKRVNPVTWQITGITMDGTGTALGNCVVDLFDTSSDAIYKSTISDSSGFYSFTVPQVTQFYIVSYKIGSPSVFGTTDNNLTGS